MLLCWSILDIRPRNLSKCRRRWGGGEGLVSSPPNSSYGVNGGTLTWLQIFAIILAMLTSNASANNLALLAGTLKTFQRHACQGAVLPLQCPSNTTIDVLHANYGGAQPPLCPFLKNSEEGGSDQSGICDYPATVNYKIIQTVVELCHRKRSCSVPVPSPSEYWEEDPCPHSNKYVEVAFKCRPDTFINKVLCEGQQITLDCGPQSRIAIYTSMFGRTKHGSMLCPQTTGFPEDDCLANFATDTVMSECHGYPKCKLTASVEVFGRPCPPEYMMYLKTVYTCVPSWILKPPETKKEVTSQIPKKTFTTMDSTAPRSSSTDDDTTISSTPRIRLNDGSKLNTSRKPMTPNEIINCTVAILSGSPEKEVGIVTEWMRAIAFINKHFEKFMLYLIIGLIGGILICVLIISSRLFIQHRRLKSHTRDTGHFVGNIDDVDEDLDMITPNSSSSEGGGYSPPPPTSHQDQNVVRFNMGTASRLPNVRASEVRPSVRYHDVDLIPPRSLSRENNHYLYN